MNIYNVTTSNTENPANKSEGLQGLTGNHANPHTNESGIEAAEVLAGLTPDSSAHREESSAAWDTDFTTFVEETPAVKHPIANSGLMGAINAILGNLNAIMKLEATSAHVTTEISNALTAIGDEMNTQLGTDSQNVQAACNNTGQFAGASSDAQTHNISATNNTYSEDQSKYQNDMAPFQRQLDQWTDTSKDLGTTTSTGFSEIQSLVQGRDSQMSR